MNTGPRLGLGGATGTRGQELLEVLDEANLGLGEVRVFAGDRSLGETVEFAGEPLPVEAGEVELTGLDAVVLCTPAAASLELIRGALRSGVPCSDC